MKKNIADNMNVTENMSLSKIMLLCSQKRWKDERIAQICPIIEHRCEFLDYDLR